MDVLTQFELSVNLWFQDLGSWLLPVMTAVTRLGSEDFYIFALTLIYWCFDKTIGVRIGLILMLSDSINGILKILAHSPRPYWVDSRVTALAAETSFGLPSGHTQNATSVFGILAVSLKRKWVWIAALIIILLMGVSRLYLGMHFLRDVIGGWLVGAILLYMFANLEAPVVDWFKRQNIWQQLGIALLSAMLMIAAGMLVRISTAGWMLPESWYTTALQAAPDHPIDPFAFQSVFTTAGVWFGLLVGLTFVTNGSGAFDPKGQILDRIVRYLLGMVGLIALYLGLGALFPRTPDLLGYGFRFLRFALVGLWTVWLAPLLFIKLRLARPCKAV